MRAVTFLLLLCFCVFAYGQTLAIVEDTSMANLKRSVVVELEQPISESELREAAYMIRDSDARNYERTFIEYYLPGMVVGAGAWATTHFNPALDVQIYGAPETPNLQQRAAIPTTSVTEDEYWRIAQELVEDYLELIAYGAVQPNFAQSPGSDWLGRMRAFEDLEIEGNISGIVCVEVPPLLYGDSSVCGFEMNSLYMSTTGEFEEDAVNITLGRFYLAFLCQQVQTHCDALAME